MHNVRGQLLIKIKLLYLGTVHVSKCQSACSMSENVFVYLEVHECELVLEL